MRVLSGRLKAVVVALFAASLIFGVRGPATTLASDPAGMSRFMDALGRAESGGDYAARNRLSGAYGKYQIMPSSWRAWADRYLGDPNAIPTPANQELVARAKVRSLYSGLGSWPRVAYWWLTGSGVTTGRSAYATRYVAKLMGYYANAAPPDVASVAPVASVASVAPVAPVAPSPRSYSERSTSISYRGTWPSATHAGYAGGAVRYATRAGATATFTFSGSSVTWYGPVGPTRGRARVSVDGKLVRTVDLRSSSFTARKAVFSQTWTAAAKHTLVIEVVGTARHPYVAIDELAVGG